MHSIFHKLMAMSQMQTPNLVTFRHAHSTAAKFFYHHLYLHLQWTLAKQTSSNRARRNNSRTSQRIMKLPLRFGSLSHICSSMGWRGFWPVTSYHGCVCRPHSYHWSKSYNSIMHSNRSLINFILVAHAQRPRIFLPFKFFHGIHR